MSLVTIRDNPVTIGPSRPSFSLPTDEWRHRISATLGFDSASTTIKGNQRDLEEIFATSLGRQFIRYSDDGQMIMWEGFINEMVLELPGLSYSMSMDSIGNRVWVRYTPLDTSVNPPVTTGSTTRTSVASDSLSQNKYGIKDMVLTAGERTAAQAEQVRDVALAFYKQPKKEKGFSSGNTGFSLKIGALGYVHTLKWPVYNQTALTGTENANLAIATRLSGLAQFIAAQEINTNTTQIAKYTDADRRLFDQLMEIAQLGDATGNRWLIQVLENRKLYYKQASDTVAYKRRLRDKRQEIIGANGVIPYSMVRPDRWMRTTDVAAMQSVGIPVSSNDDDFQLMYIDSVEYTEPDGLVLHEDPRNTVSNTISRQASEGGSVL